MPKNIFSFFSKKDPSNNLLHAVSSDMLAFVEQLPVAVLLVDQDGKIGQHNEAAAKLLGQTQAQLSGKIVWDVLGTSAQEFDSWQTQGQKTILQVKIPGNKTVALQAGAKKLGQTPWTAVTLEEVPLLETLQTQKAQLQEILDGLSGALTVQDEQGKCVFWSASASRLFGVNAKEARGKIIYQLLPKTLSAFVYGLDEELKAGKLRQEPAHFTLPAQEGSAEKCLAITKSWVGNAPRLLITRYEDVTSRLAHQQDLERSQKLLQAILENIPLGLYTRDCDKKVTFINKQGLAILNETPDSLEEKHECQTQEESDSYNDRERQILREGKTYEYPGEVYVDSSGKERTVHIIKVPLFDAGPKPLVLTIIEDITKRLAQEQEIERVNSFFSAVVQNAPIALYARAEDGHMLLRNKQCSELFGPIEDSDFDDRGGLAHETDAQVTNYINREREILKTGKTVDIPEEEYITPSGEKKLLHLVKAPVKEGNCVITLVEDISVKKAQERALIESKNFLQTVINQLPVSLSVKNYDGEYILWNKKSEELFGVSAQEVIGRSAYRSDLNKEQLEFVRETDLRVFENKKEQNIPQELVSSANEGIKIMHTVKTPVFNSDGTPNCLLVVSEDITAKTKMEKQIREASDKNTLLVENAREGVVLVEDGKIIYANHAFCAMLGFDTLEELKGKKLLDLSTENHRVFLKEKYEAVRSGNDDGSTSLEAHFVRKDGKKLEAKFSAVLAKYLGRRVILGFLNDITAENNLLRTLKQERNNFRQAFEKQVLPALILSPKGYISRMNAAARKLFGFTEDDKKFYSNVYIRPGIPLSVRKAMREGMSVQTDYVFDFDKIARQFPDHIHKTGRQYLWVWFEPIAKRDVQDGSVEAEYLVCIEPKDPPAAPALGAAGQPADGQTVPEGPLPAQPEQPAASLPPLPPFLTPQHHGSGETRLVLPNSEPYALCNDDFIITECNPLFCSLCQLHTDELKGSDIRRLFHPDDAPLIEQDFRLLRKEGKLSNREYTILLGSSLETCKVRLMAVREESGQLLFVLHSLAFHLQIMKILEERSAQLSALRSATDGAVLRVDFTHRKLGSIEQLNNWLSCQSQYSHKELSQMKFGDLFFDPSQEDESPAFELSKAQSALARQGQATLQLPLRRKDGSSFMAQVTLSLIDIPQRNEALAVISNLTSQQKKWGEASKEAQELCSLRQALPGLYLRVDAGGKVAEVSSNLPDMDNAQAQAVFLSKTPGDFWPEDAASQALFAIKEALSVHVSTHFEFEWPRENHVKYCEAEVSPLASGKEAILWVKDASEKRVYDEQLHELYRLSQKTDLSLTDQVEQLLALGNQIFQTDMGLVLRFEHHKDRLESVVLYASKNSKSIERGMEFAVEECLRDVADGAVVLLPDMEGLSCTHCIHRAKNFGALLAAPLVVDGRVEGALCFVSGEARRSCRPGAEELLGLMARLLGLRIELRQAGKSLAVAGQTFARMLDALQLPALRVSEDFYISYVNLPLSKWLGREPKKLIGREFFAELVRDEEQTKKRVLETLRHTGGTEPCLVKLDILLPSGLYQTVEWEIIPAQDDQGHIEGYSLLVRGGK